MSYCTSTAPSGWREADAEIVVTENREPDAMSDEDAAPDARLPSAAAVLGAETKDPRPESGPRSKASVESPDTALVGGAAVLCCWLG